MTKPPEKSKIARKLRCAVYTRKSSEEGLEQEFNSLHAQREACEAYIASQRSEGWVLVRDQYDDGGISGGTLERPGLKRLLEDIEDGLVDVVVVYKIDRLSRSLADFAKLVEVFDRNGVTFVSVTQSFNTTTSMGRLTLNILLSFAQFEREVTAERIRDKVAASRRKGMWMGGVPPFGYRVENRKLVIDEEGAAHVETQDEPGRRPPPIRLESLDAQFELECQVSNADSTTRLGLFTVIRCRSPETETIRYFLSVCSIIMRHLGSEPSRANLAAAVRRMASIFQSIKKPPVRSLIGLFGELFVISRSRSPMRTVSAWRVDETSRFDFSVGDIRIDVKSSAGRARKHIFAYDQCNPPRNTHAVVASLMVERVPRGVSIDDLVGSIEGRLAGDPELVLKLHDIVASTLGAELTTSLRVTFDNRLAESSLQFFDLRTIPAVRDPIQPRVSDVRFAVDLSGLPPLSFQELTDQDPYFWDFLPAE